MEAMRRVTGMFCPLPVCQTAAEFSNQRELVKHMKNKHQSEQFCELCLGNRPLFPAEQTRYSIVFLKQHERSPDGHPLCLFCQKRFFDGANLFSHMNGVHINCHICPLEQRSRYYRNLVQLRDHLRSNHHLCECPPCDSTEVVQAFSTSEELRIHIATEHGGKSSKPITLGFKIASSRDRGRDEDELRQGVICPPPARHPSSQTDMNQLSMQRQGRSFVPFVSQNWANARGTQQSGEVVGPDSSQFNTVFPSLPTPTSRIDPEELSLVGQHHHTTATRNNRIPPSYSNTDNVNLSSSAGGRTTSKGKKERNRRLAITLGIGVRNLDEMENSVQWPRELVLWARENLSEVVHIQNLIQKMLLDPKATSFQLKPMARLHRKRVHELAEMYLLKSVSYDPEPKRYLSIVKQQASRICRPLLSEAARDVSYCVDSSSTSHQYHKATVQPEYRGVNEEEKKEECRTNEEGGDDEIRWRNSVFQGRLMMPEGRLTLVEEARMKAIEKERQATENRRARVMEDSRRVKEQAGYIELHETPFHGLDVQSDDGDDQSSSKDEWEMAADRIMLSPVSGGGGGDAWNDDDDPEEPRAPYPSEGMWVCKRCTYSSNSDSVQNCGMCGEENTDIGWTVVK